MSDRALRMLRIGVCFAILNASFCRAADRVPLLVLDPAGLREPWPMACGVPMPRGRLDSTDRVRVVTANGQEVPVQVDCAATWQDGSIRWLRLAFSGRTDDGYAVEFGEGVRRTSVPQHLRISEEDGALTVETGVAVFRLPRDAVLFDSVISGGVAVLRGAGQGATVIDNRGLRARLGGPGGDVTREILSSGPLRACIRTEGWYVVEQTGERVARGIVWLYVGAGSASVRIVHRLVLTEDTNERWFRDIALEFPSALPDAERAIFDTDREFGSGATPVLFEGGDALWMMQDDYPHFMSTSSHFALGRGETIIESGPACGDWCSVTGPDAGFTVVLRELAEQFPKELTATPRGISAHLWAGRSGRELDFRSPSLVRDYWGDWCRFAPGGPEALAKRSSNAQCSARTHEIWLIPHTGPFDTAATERRAQAAGGRVLVLPDPAWTCETGVLGLPILHRDPNRFPEQEALISDFFDRTVLPYEVFPMTGYIAWGCNPYLRYQRDKETGSWYAEWYRLRSLVDYNLRRNVWTLYARSGDRKYFDYGERFNRFSADWEMHHWDAPGDSDRNRRIKGGWAASGDIHKPYYWGERSEVLTQGSSGTDILNYMLEYYMTGDWHTRDAAEKYGTAMKTVYDCEKVAGAANPFLIFRCLRALPLRRVNGRDRRRRHSAERPVPEQGLSPAVLPRSRQRQAQGQYFGGTDVI